MGELLKPDTKNTVNTLPPNEVTAHFLDPRTGRSDHRSTSVHKAGLEAALGALPKPTGLELVGIRLYESKAAEETEGDTLNKTVTRRPVSEPHMVTMWEDNAYQVEPLSELAEADELPAHTARLLASLSQAAATLYRHDTFPQMLEPLLEKPPYIIGEAQTEAPDERCKRLAQLALEQHPELLMRYVALGIVEGDLEALRGEKSRGKQILYCGLTREDKYALIRGLSKDGFETEKTTGLRLPTKIWAIEGIAGIDLASPHKDDEIIIELASGAESVRVRVAIYRWLKDLADRKQVSNQRLAPRTNI